MTTFKTQPKLALQANGVEAPTYWLLRNRMTVLTNHAATGGQYDLIEAHPAPDHQTPLHTHQYSEQFVMLAGEVTVWAGSRTVVLRAGDTFTVPAGTAHVAAVTGDEPVHSLVISRPSGFARLIAEAGVPATSDTPPEITPDLLDRLQRAAELVGDEIIGPPGTLPEG